MKCLALVTFLLHGSAGSILSSFMGSSIPESPSSSSPPVISIVSCNNSENPLTHNTQYQIGNKNALPESSNYFVPTILNYSPNRFPQSGSYAGGANDDDIMDIGNRIRRPLSNIPKIWMPSRLNVPSVRPEPVKNFGQNNFGLEEMNAGNTLDVEARVKFYLFTRKNHVVSQELKIHHPSTINESHFSPSLETKLIFHGFTDVDAAGEWVNVMKETYLTVSNVNLIVADFSSFPLQTLLPSSIPIFAAKRLTEFLTFLATEAEVPLRSIHIIARSYGCHVVGMSGRLLDGKLGQITALEPSPKVTVVGSPPEFKLGKDDALFVQVIHVNGKRFFFHGPQFGLVAPMGDVDVYPSVAERGLGCPGENNNLNVRRYSLGYCQLGRGVRYFTNSLKYPDMYPMCQCSSFDNYKAGHCSCHSRETMRFLGEILTTTHGVFQLAVVPQTQNPSFTTYYNNNLFG